MKPCLKKRKTNKTKQKKKTLINFWAKMTNPWSVSLPSLAYTGLGGGKLQAGSFWQLPTGDSGITKQVSTPRFPVMRLWKARHVSGAWRCHTQLQLWMALITRWHLHLAFKMHHHMFIKLLLHHIYLATKQLPAHTSKSGLLKTKPWTLILKSTLENQ